jgi:1-acyl-sn-glycerol-3-phosphate acyltransferase
MSVPEPMNVCPPGVGECPVSVPAERLPWRPWQVVRFTLGYLTHVLADLAFFLVMLPVTTLLFFLPGQRYRLIRGLVDRYLVLLFHHWLPALGIYRVDEVSGLDRARGEAPAVFVANHRCVLDAPLLLSHLQRTGLVIKSRYARRGALAILARHFDFIPIDPRSLDSVGAMTAGCRRLVEEGKSVLIFPEGSRSLSGRLLPFRASAFRLAVEQGRPVVPVIVHTTVPFMTKEAASYYPREPIRLRFRFMAPERPKGGETADDLAARVHRLMARELRELDLGTAWAVRQGPRP